MRPDPRIRAAGVGCMLGLDPTMWLTTRDPAMEIALAAAMGHAAEAHDTAQRNLAVRIATAIAGREVT